MGNARRLVARYRRRIRYVPPWGRWLLWDGCRWAPDQIQQMMECAKETVRYLHSKATEIPHDAARSDAADEVRRCERAERLRAMLSLARSEEGIPVMPMDLDADPWRLNCVNATVDLRSGEFQEHDPIHKITKLAPVVYEPEERLDLWDKFLDQVTGGDAELAEFLQRAVGYTLSGSTKEEVVFFLLGSTATGKSTFVEAIRAALGDYAMTADFETFLRQHQARGPRNDVARLAGARLVTASEVPAGRQFDEGLLKQLTGGDTVTARFLHKEFFEFRPQFKLWLAANHRPMVRDDDPAIWRRLRIIPFDTEIPEAERDPSVKEALRNPRTGGRAILAWAVEGCRKWQREGLGSPRRIQEATREYRDEMGTFVQFLEDYCVEDPASWIDSAALLLRYQRWIFMNGQQYPIGPRRVAEALRARGHTPKKQGGKRGWQGLALVESGGQEGTTT
jgi:putative DNA primase/helicase